MTMKITFTEALILLLGVACIIWAAFHVVNTSEEGSRWQSMSQTERMREMDKFVPQRQYTAKGALIK